MNMLPVRIRVLSSPLTKNTSAAVKLRRDRKTSASSSTVIDLISAGVAATMQIAVDRAAPARFLEPVSKELQKVPVNALHDGMHGLARRFPVVIIFHTNSRYRSAPKLTNGRQNSKKNNQHFGINT